MRKLAYAIIVLLGIACIWSVAAWLSPPIKTNSENLFKAISNKGYVSISSGWTQLRTGASASGTTFLVYTLVILVVVSPFLWLGIWKLLGRGSTYFGKVKKTASSVSSSVTSAVRSTTPPGATTRPKTSNSVPSTPEAEVPVEEEPEVESTT